MQGLFKHETPSISIHLKQKTSEVYPRTERPRHEEEYAANDDGCMILEVQTSKGWMCLDATRLYAIPGSLLNDAQARAAILKPFRPLFVQGKLRVAFLATRNIKKGEELTWDYGCPPENQQWLMRRKTKRQGH